jgi:hypothetical protein
LNIVLYGIYTYSRSNSFRLSSEILKPLINRSPITIFKALKKLMLKLRTRGVELKGKNNSIRIKHLDRKPRHRAFKKQEEVHGNMISQQYSFLLVEKEVRIMFHQVMLKLKKLLR